MSKQLLALSCLVLVLMLGATAVAEPLLTNGTDTAYLGQNNWLYLQGKDGSTRHLKTPIADVVGIDDEKMYCVTTTGALWSVNLDGSASAIIASRPREEDFASVAMPQVYTLEGGVLTILSSNEIISINAIAASATPDALYYVERMIDGSHMLIEKALDGSHEKNRAMYVGKPVAINASMQYVCLVTEQRTVQVIDLSCWGMLEFPATSADTAAAIFAKDKLIRFTKNEIGDYLTESVEPVTASFIPTATPRPTFSPRPTATLRPVVTPASTETAQMIAYGVSGDDVERMQQRLIELGYPAEATGTFDDTTLLALNLFQYAVGHTEREYASEKLLEVLYSQSAVSYYPLMPLYENDRGTPVKVMQQKLNQKGYAVTENGIYGKDTVRACAQFLADAGMESDGTVMTSMMLEELYR